MVASLSLRVQTGSSPGTKSSAVTGVDLISADNATNSLANRQANPLTVGTRSYEKYLRLEIDTAPANAVSNFLVWGDGSVAANTTLYFKGEVASYATPTNATSSVATEDFTDYDSGNKAQWDDGSYDTIGDLTEYIVFQLAVGGPASPGNWPTETVSYSYDET